MEYSQILDRGLALIGDGKPAVFTTRGTDGSPRSRWMVPASLPRLRGRIFAVTARGFAKAEEIAAEPRVQWTFQAPDFSEVVSIEGKACVVNDPSFAAEVLKAIGPNLPFFWRINTDPSAVVVIETRAESATILYPMRAERFSASARAPEGPGVGK